MDIRIEKTKVGIRNAFLELRAHKPLEKITVKELCEKARINKSTFYSHYMDIYQLSETLEEQIVQNVLDNLIHPEALFTNPKQFVQELFMGYTSQDALLNILFSGNLSNRLPEKIRDSLRSAWQNTILTILTILPSACFWITASTADTMPS